MAGDGATSAAQDVRIVVLSGPSGSGKTTVVQKLLEAAPVPLVKAISATTRAPRPGEIDGHDYYFLTPAEFETRRLRNDFVECFEVFKNGSWYGTLHTEIERARQSQAWALLEIDVQGAQRVLQHYPQTVTIFLTASSPAEFERRLRARNTEDETAIQRRLQQASDELRSAGWYRHRVVNDSLCDAITEISDILLQAQT